MKSVSTDITRILPAISMFDNKDGISREDKKQTVFQKLHSIFWKILWSIKEIVFWVRCKNWLNMIVEIVFTNAQSLQQEGVFYRVLIDDFAVFKNY